MPDVLVHGLIGGAGVAGIWIICMIFGFMYAKPHVDDLKQEIVELKEAKRISDERADSERNRADAAVEAARTSNLLLAAIGRGVTGNDPTKI